MSNWHKRVGYSDRFDFASLISGKHMSIEAAQSLAESATPLCVVPIYDDEFYDIPMRHWRPSLIGIEKQSGYEHLHPCLTVSDYAP